MAISFDEFKKLEIAMAKVLEAEDHPNADKLYVLKIELGGETRQIVAGIREHYKKEDLIGKQIVVIKNIEPAKIRGVESNGMLLVAKDDKALAILVPEKEVAVGSPIS